MPFTKGFVGIYKYVDEKLTFYQKWNLDISRSSSVVELDLLIYWGLGKKDQNFYAILRSRKILIFSVW